MPALIPEELRDEALATIHQLSRAKILAPRIAKDGRVLEVQLTSTALLSDTG